jgi:hypothetical protein
MKRCGSRLWAGFPQLQWSKSCLPVRQVLAFLLQPFPKGSLREIFCLLFHPGKSRSPKALKNNFLLFINMQADNHNFSDDYLEKITLFNINADFFDYINNKNYILPQ